MLVLQKNVHVDGLDAHQRINETPVFGNSLNLDILHFSVENYVNKIIEARGASSFIKVYHVLLWKIIDNQANGLFAWFDEINCVELRKALAFFLQLFDSHYAIIYQICHFDKLVYYLRGSFIQNK